MQQLPKSLFIFVFCVPLAVVFGVLLANPLDTNTMVAVLTGFLLLLSPILLKHHHTALILFWNAYINAFFLPGQPYVWMLATAISIVLIVLTSTVNRGKMTLLYVPSVARPLIFLFIVSAITAKLTGGVGTQLLGSEVYGGKRYVFVWGSIIGFFALSAIPVKEKHRQLLAGLFFLSGITAVASNIAFMLGEKFYYLFLLFPVEYALTQAAAEYSVGGFTRIGGLAPASIAMLSFVLLRYGIRGVLDFAKPWRFIGFAGSITASLFSGFRSSFLTIALLIFTQFFVEGLHRTKYLLAFTATFLIVASTVLPFADKLPLSVQRSLTVLPLDLDRAAVDAARGSTEWRLDMWRAIIPDIPKYLIIPKGYALDPKDMYFSQQHISRRIFNAYEPSLVSGDYHNGPLTLIIPLGIWGVIGFLWFYVAGYKVLYNNLKFGDPSIKNINRFLLTYYIAKMIFFVFIFGAFYLDFVSFIGAVALSISMNRGVAQPALAPALVPVRAKPIRALPAFQPPFPGGLQGA